MVIFVHSQEPLSFSEISANNAVHTVLRAAVANFIISVGIWSSPRDFPDLVSIRNPPDFGSIWMDRSRNGLFGTSRESAGMFNKQVVENF